MKKNNASIICRTTKPVALLVVFLTLGLTSCIHSIQRPRAMDLFKPDSTKKDVKLPVPTSRTLTLLLGSNNRALYYLGNPQKPLDGPVLTGYGKDSLGKVLKTEMARMKDTTDGYLVILIKPSDKSNYKNFVNTIDLINICGVKSYGVVDIDSSDVALLKKNHAY